MKWIKPDIPYEMIDKWQKNVDLMATVIEVPAALIMKIYPLEVEVFLASATADNPYKKGQKFNLDIGLYSETIIAQRSQLLIPDARRDPQWERSPDVALGMISYLGLPLIWPDGEMFGIICVLDRKENHYTPVHQKLIWQIKNAIDADLNLILKITEHKRAKEALEKLKAELDNRVEIRTTELKKAEEKYRHLVEKEKDIIYTVDEEGTYTWINPAVEAILGYKPEEIIGKRFSVMIPQEWQEKSETDFRKLLDAGEITAEIAVFDKKGGIHFIEHNSTVIKEGGRILGARGIARDITERKRVEDSLRESGERLKYILDSIPVGILIIEPQKFSIVDANPPALKMIGAPKEQVIGSNCRKFICAPEASCPAIDLKQRIYDSESFLIKADGQKIPILKTVVPVTLKNKEYLLEVFIDIAKRKQAEERVLKQNTVLEAINKVFQETLVCRTDEEVARMCLSVAENLTGSMFGFIAEINEKGLFDTIAISDPGWDACRIPKSNAVKMLKNMEIRGIRRLVIEQKKSLIINNPAFRPEYIQPPQGHPEITSFIGIPLMHAGKLFGMIALANKEGGYLPDDQEALESLSGTFVEALMHKRAEEVSRESEKRFRFVASATFDAIWDWDLLTDAIVWNEGLKTLFGYSNEEVGPDSNWWKERIHPEDKKRVTSGVYSAIEKGVKKWADEYRFLRKDGSYAFVIDRGYVSHDEKGKPVRMVGAMMDVTERKKSEAELIQAQKLASIGQLAAGVAHEINNPLSAISGEIQWLSKRNENKKLSKSLQLMEKLCDRIAKIVNNLLIFSREASTKIKEPSSVDSLVEKTLLLVGRRLSANNIKITKKIKTHLPEVLVNRGEIEQALMNIFLNSLDAMPRGGKLTISTRLSRDKKSAEITIADTGTGIAKKDLPRVFEPFFTTKAPGKGAGLGLYLSHGIIKKHNGSIEIDSKLNKGTKISIKLPLRQPGKAK
ncbi:MAG: PAS domain S-box protein [Candidatus Omnitrophota bacterium]